MNYIKGFDTLRAFSIILVLLTHLGLYEILPENNFLQSRFWNLISGTTGVQLFFTLSGFLITSILIQEKNKNGFINFRNFYIRRFLRLLPPLLIFYCMVGICMQMHWIHTTSIGLIFSFFYLYNFVPNQFYTAELGHTWSLAVEEQFYLTWPFIINYFKKTRNISLVVFGILLLSLLGVYLLPDSLLASSFRVNYWFIPAVAPIIIGSFFAVLSNREKEKWIKISQQNSQLLWISLLLFSFPLYAPQSILKATFIFQSIAAALFLIWVLYNQESNFTSVLNHKIPSYIGKISYGLYVYQGFFLRTGPGGNLSVQQFPLNIVCTIVVAILSYEFIEKPVLQLKHKFK